MRAELLVPHLAYRRGASTTEPTLYTYAVPDRLAARLTLGQLVAVPFGQTSVPALVWALDASDDAQPPSDDDDDAPKLHEIADILSDEPLVLPAQRALAEWLADYYATSLAAAARLMLPPGMLRGLRTVLRLADAAPSDTAHGAPAIPPAPDAPAEPLYDQRMVLGMLHERGWLDRDSLDQVLGRRRAVAAVQALRAQQRVVLVVEPLRALDALRHERYARLRATPEELDTWRMDARARLDTLPTPAIGTQRRPAWQRAKPGERAAERLLRQLAVLDVLARAQVPQANTPQTTWRVEELLHLTRATAHALAELEHAGLVAIDTLPTRHDPLAGRSISRSTPLALTPAQAAALAAIVGPPPTPRHATHAATAPHEPSRVFLLHGITGSGKTEVYLQALAAVIARGQQGIVLVPEIALTPQAMARYAGRFPGRVALLHSGLSAGERLDEWRRIRAGAVDVVLGSRSALFAPVQHLGLLIVDEEHEGAYKQERAPTYHARDTAVRLGALTHANVVLGSATPSVESYWLASQGVYTLLELRARATLATGTAADATQVAHASAEVASAQQSVVAVPTVASAASTVTGLPPVSLIDLRAELRAGNTSILSETLRSAMRQALERGEQAILFLNRRGSASSIVCRECGYAVRCDRCDVSMTFHASDAAVICHYCGKHEPAPQTCPVCWSASIRYFGLGTERVEAAVKRLFPAARVLRWDRDTARTRQAHEDLLRAFAERRADVLVGTQMIAKGLDLPGVTLVGVVSADVALFLPDFRASERAFQLLTQVAGRAGRGATPGVVLVQTFNPDHFCIQAAARHDYATFFEAEILARRRYGYPPFRRFVKCTYEHSDRYTAQVEATVLCERLERTIEQLGLAETDLVGPAPAFMERLRGRYRWQVIVRSPDPRPLLRALRASELGHGWSIDIDPASTL